MSDPQQPQVPPYAQPQPPSSARYGQHAPHPQGYVLNGNAAQPGYPVPVANANPPGRLGFVFGLIGIVVGLIANLATNLLLYTGGIYAVEAASWASTLLVLAIAGVALGFGIAGLRRPNAPHGQAGIAVGIAIAMIAGSVGSIVINAIGAVLFRY